MRKPLGALPAYPPLDGMRAESAAAEQQLQQAQAAAKAGVQETADSSSLAEAVDRILDKGIVVDAGVEASLVGTELLSVEARVVIASVETYLKHAEASGLTANGATPT